MLEKKEDFINYININNNFGFVLVMYDVDYIKHHKMSKDNKNRMYDMYYHVEKYNDNDYNTIPNAKLNELIITFNDTNKPVIWCKRSINYKINKKNFIKINIDYGKNLYFNLKNITHIDDNILVMRHDVIINLNPKISKLLNDNCIIHSHCRNIKLKNII